jgi:hypothetical protein
MEILKKFLLAIHPRNLGLYILASALVFGLFYYHRSYEVKDTISVNGVAYENVKADKATWEITIENKDNDRVNSLNKLKNQEKKLVAFLKSNGIRDREISKGTYSTWTIYKKAEDGYTPTNKVDSYSSSVYYKVDTSDVGKIATLGNKLNDFIVTEGIYLSDNNRSYIYTGLEDLKVELLKEAINNARERADSMSEVTGNEVKEIENASQGVFQINPRDDYSVSGVGNFDTTSIKKTVRATVGVEFAVE